MDPFGFLSYLRGVDCFAAGVPVAQSKRLNFVGITLTWDPANEWIALSADAYGSIVGTPNWTVSTPPGPTGTGTIFAAQDLTINAEGDIVIGQDADTIDFRVLPIAFGGPTPTLPEHLVTKAYADSIAGGAVPIASNTFLANLTGGSAVPSATAFYGLVTSQLLDWTWGSITLFGSSTMALGAGGACSLIGESLDLSTTAGAVAIATTGGPVTATAAADEHIDLNVSGSGMVRVNANEVATTGNLTNSSAISWATGPGAIEAEFTSVAAGMCIANLSGGATPPIATACVATATASSVCARDANGDCAFRYLTAERVDGGTSPGSAALALGTQSTTASTTIGRTGAGATTTIHGSAITLAAGGNIALRPTGDSVDTLVCAVTAGACKLSSAKAIKIESTAASTASAIDLVCPGSSSITVTGGAIAVSAVGANSVSAGGVASMTGATGITLGTTSGNFYVGAANNIGVMLGPYGSYDRMRFFWGVNVATAATGAVTIAAVAIAANTRPRIRGTVRGWPTAGGAAQVAHFDIIAENLSGTVTIYTITAMTAVAGTASLGTLAVTVSGTNVIVTANPGAATAYTWRVTDIEDL